MRNVEAQVRCYPWKARRCRQHCRSCRTLCCDTAACACSKVDFLLEGLSIFCKISSHSLGLNLAACQLPQLHGVYRSIRWEQGSQLYTLSRKRAHCVVSINLHFLSLRLIRGVNRTITGKTIHTKHAGQIRCAVYVYKYCCGHKNLPDSPAPS